MSGPIFAGSTDQYAEVKVWTVADGLPKTDITSATSGLAIKYQVGNGSIGTLTAASMSAGGSHADGGIYHIGNGSYKIGMTDALVASVGNLRVWIELTGCDSAPDQIRVVGYNPHAVAVGANTVTPATPTNVSDVQTAVLAKLPAALVGGRMDASVGAMQSDTLTAAALAADACAELAALVESYIVNEGDATAVMQAIADKIAADWVAGDASPLAIATAVWSAATRTLTAVPNVTVGGYAAGQSPADLVTSVTVSGNVTVGSLTQAALAQFVVNDSGQTSAAIGSVAKISQGSAGADYTEQLGRIEAKTNLITAGRVAVVSPVTQTGDLNLQIGVDYAEQDALSITVAAGAALRTFLQSEDVTHVWFLAARDRHTNEMKIELDPDGISDVADDGSVTIPISITRDQVPTEKGAYPGGIYVETSTGKFFRRTASNVYVDRSPGKLPTT